MGDLFGGGSEGSVTTVPTLTENQQKLLSYLSKNAMGGGVDTYGGNFTPGASGLQQGAFSSIEDMLAGGQGMGQAQDFMTGLMQPYDPAAAKTYYQDAILAPTMQNWQNEVLPQVREAMISQGAGSSGAANRAIAKSGADMMTGLNANMASTIYGDKQQYTQNALGGAQGLSGLNSLLASLGLQGGQAQRGIASELGQENMSKWQMSQDWGNPWLQYAPSALQTNAFDTVVQQGHPGEGFGSTMMGLAAAYGMAFSSRRLKSNIKYLSDEPGKMGLRPVEFEYNWSPGKTEHGFIAEDVEKVMPDAVVYSDDGEIIGLDYALIATRLAA